MRAEVGRLTNEIAALRVALATQQKDGPGPSMAEAARARVQGI